ncbi:hypothetical protein V6N13_101246 [Hibiscus sabdariffa]
MGEDDGSMEAVEMGGDRWRRTKLGKWFDDGESMRFSLLQVLWPVGSCWWLLAAAVGGRRQGPWVQQGSRQVGIGSWQTLEWVWFQLWAVWGSTWACKKGNVK